MPSGNVTERQAKWFASVRASLERDTGLTMAEWIEIARACPETGPRARLKWLKENHGLLQNRASLVISEAFAPATGWDTPEALIGALWIDPESRAIFEAVDAATGALSGAMRTARKSYTAWSRNVQFAAARPLRAGRMILGLAVPIEAWAALEPPRSESWSERLKSRIVLTSPADVDGHCIELLTRAWDSA